MAKKKKTKAERKEARRRAMEAKREETGWEPPEPDLPPIGPDVERPRVVEDARALFPGFGSALGMEAEMGDYLAAIVDSDWMTDEAEFEAIYLPPIHLAGRYIEAAEAAGFDPASFELLDEEKRADRHIDFLTRAIDDLLTEEIEDDILDAMECLRERLIEEGEREQAARAGLVLDFMEQEESATMWSTVGVVLALGQRSLDAGFALTQTAAATGEILTEDSFELSPEVQAVLERYPGLVEYLAVRQDRAWEDGLQSLFSADLRLELYRVDELDAQLDTWQRVLESDETDEVEDVEVLVKEINRYITGLLTAERINQVVAQIEAALDSGTLGPEEETFVGMLAAALTEEEIVAEGITALMAAFFGELRQHVEEME
ncbi:MAG: hypothetical protein JXA93_09515 [Anaerolineae bacterium]|nr:hypothetical protein [Anaerolineae bacterium]